MLGEEQFFNSTPFASLRTGNPIHAVLCGWNDEFAVTMGESWQTMVNASWRGFVVQFGGERKGMPIGIFEKCFLTVNGIACFWEVMLILMHNIQCITTELGKLRIN
jgi:hypothetical protein